MALKTLQVTLGSGARTQLSSTRIPCRQVIVQNNATHFMRVGDSTTTTSIGALLNASTGANQGGGSVNIGPFQAYNTDLSEWYVAGTQNDLVDVTYVT